MAIQTPSGRQILIDGGASPEALFGELGAAMPFWDRTIDLLVLTHPDGDHMLAQVEVPARYQVAQLVRVGPDRFPWATFWTNVSGSLVLGFLLVLVIHRFPPTRFVRPFFATGFLGAFTTFSTFAVETDLLVALRRGSRIWPPLSAALDAAHPATFELDD